MLSNYLTAFYLCLWIVFNSISTCEEYWVFKPKQSEVDHSITMLQSLLADGYLDPQVAPLTAANAVNDQYAACDFKKITPDFSPQEYSMCLRKDDAVSDQIRKHGQWFDCQELMQIWKEPDTSSGLFLDVGANIGSCSLLMAANSITTLAFEPLASNYNIFVQSINANFLEPTNTTAKLPFSQFIWLYPFGLGDKAYSTVAFMQLKNIGNTVIGHAVSDIDKSPDTMLQQPVNVKVLDEVIWANRPTGAPPPMIKLMKLDVQGFETKVLEGAKNLLRNKAIQTIKFELSPRWLHAQNSSGFDLCSLLTSYGFVLRNAKKRVLKPRDCNGRFEYIDVVARLQ